MRKEKIIACLPLPPPYSGVETLTQFFLESPLKDEFHIIHVDTSNKRSNDVRGRFDFLNLLRTYQTAGRILLKMLACRPQIANIPISRNRFGFLRDGLYILICSHLGAKIVSRMTGDHFGVFHDSENILMKTYIRMVLKKISVIIVRGDCIKGQFDGIYPKDQIETVYLPFASDYYEDIEDVVKPSEKDGISRVLFMGHIGKSKGAFDLIESIGFVLGWNERVKFLFAGTVMQTERNIKFIENPEHMNQFFADALKRFGKHVEYIGMVKGGEKKRLLKSVDILVLPSYSEGFPFVVLEAMAAKLPVIATRVGALPEVFEDGKNILFVPIGNPEAIAEALLTLLQDERLRKEMGSQNERLVRERFNLNVFAERMSSIYKSVLEEGK